MMELKQNRLLAVLPAASLEQLEPKFTEMTAQRQQVLYEAAKPIGHAYFPLAGWLSNVVVLADAMAEIGLVGTEGMAGLSMIRGSTSLYRTLVQSNTVTYASISRSDLMERFNADEILRSLLLRYAEANASQMAYTAACNGWHDVSNRLARWLLLVHDRANGDDLPLTHEFLAMMLCVHRPRITRTAKLLQDAGIIAYRHGIVKVIDRAALEGRTCECYWRMKSDFERLLPGSERSD